MLTRQAPPAAVPRVVLPTRVVPPPRRRVPAFAFAPEKCSPTNLTIVIRSLAAFALVMVFK